MKRIITAHRGNKLNDSLSILAIGEPGPGGAAMQYEIREVNRVSPCLESESDLDVKFQSGDPAKEINGISNEALLAIVLHRLEGFQDGPFACESNRAARDAVELALQHLKSRTHDRINRGVEGQQVV